jgi:DNA-directed RNA polymerase omega subunit
MSNKLRGSLTQQSYVPLEKVTQHVQNKYEAVVVAAAEARKINSVLRMVGRDEAQEKVTSRALRRICTGDIDYVYLDESERLAEAEAFAAEVAPVVESAVPAETPAETVNSEDNDDEETPSAG